MPGTSRSYIRRLAAQRGVRGGAREQISPLSETTSRNSRYSHERGVGSILPGRNETAESAPYEESKAEGDGGGGVEEVRASAPRKEIKEPRRTRHFEFPARGPPGRAAGAAGPVSAQSVDKRVVRTVLNRSEYLYAGFCLRTFFAVVVVACLAHFHLQTSPAVSS